MLTCCGFGNRVVLNPIGDKVKGLISSVIEQGCYTFYTGAMGEFDKMFSSAVRAAKIDDPEVKLICVKPYLTSEITSDREYVYSLYDDIIIPTELAFTHPKAAISKRNRWIIDHSDIVMIYTIRDYGGAYDALKYAKERGKKVIRICCD